MPAHFTIVDLDEELGFVDDEPVHVTKIKLLGRQWTVICDLNMFAMADIANGEAGNIAKFIRNLIHPDERDEFAEALASARNLDGERLGKLLQKLIEVAGERPTESPSRSPRTAKSRTSAPKSLAR